MIKQIFCDMDGTLLDDSGQVSRENIRQIKETGIDFTLVSARAPIEMALAIEPLGLTAPQIAFNGGLIFQGEKILDQSPLNFDSSRQILEFLTVNFPEISVSYYTQKAWWAPRIDAGIELESSLTRLMPTVISLAEFFELAGKLEPIFKIMLIISEPEVMKKVQQALAEMDLPAVNVQQSNWNYLEITSRRATKARGLKFLIAQKGLKREEMAALGDGHNDLPMFDLVGLPIAMANANEEVKRAAKLITKSNVEDGVAYALRHFLG